MTRWRVGLSMPDPVSPVVFGAPMLPDAARLAAITARALAVGGLSNGGPLHMPFEQALSADQAVGDVVSLTSSGTMAPILALMLCNLPAGAKVNTTPLTFIANARAIAERGLLPVFADVEPDMLTLYPRAVEQAITPRAAAILLLQFPGLPCDAAALACIASRHGLWLAYDAAHAFGDNLTGQPFGHYGDASVFSLHATKLPHTAEGGLVVALARDHFARVCWPGTAWENSGIIIAGGGPVRAPERGPGVLDMSLHARITDQDAGRITAIITATRETSATKRSQS